jgi:GTPase SAR1 family protein
MDKNAEIRVAMIGPAGVGKTEILRRLSGNLFRPAYHPTSATETWTVEFTGRRFIVTEYSGQEQLRDVPQAELDAISAYIVVTTKRKLDTRSAKILAARMPVNIPHCIVFNKSDLSGMTDDDCCSAKTMENLEAPFYFIANYYTNV